MTETPAAQGPLNPDSESPTVIHTRLSVPKMSTRLRSGSMHTPEKSPRVESRSSSSMSKVQTRRISTEPGTLTDPTTMEDDRHASLKVQSGTNNEAEIETPTRPRRAKRVTTSPSDSNTNQTPPPLPHKSQSSPGMLITPKSDKKTTTNSELNPYELDRGIVEWIRKPLTEGAKKDKGDNYLFSVLHEENPEFELIKVGKTSQMKSKRQKQIQLLCEITLKPLNPNSRLIRHSLNKRAESLVLQELKNMQFKFSCESCGKEHTEYFIVSPDIALETTQRWNSFCEKEPWDRSGKLQPFWAERLEEWEACFQNDTDDKQRADRWTKFVHPSWLEIAIFNMTRIRKVVWPRKWEFVCYIQTLYITYVAFPNLWVAIIFWAVQFGIFLDITFEKDALILSRYGRRVNTVKVAPPNNGADSKSPARQDQRKVDSVSPNNMKEDLPSEEENVEEISAETMDVE